MDADPGTALTLTWDAITSATSSLAVRVATDGAPQTVVGIMRGGMIPAVMLAHQLRIRDVRTVEVTHTVADGIDAAKSASPTAINTASLGNLTGRDVLLIDDIAGSGSTLAHTAWLIKTLEPRRLRTAVLTVNRANWTDGPEPRSRIDYIASLTDTWVVFPWEEQHGH
ncbi:phosphoribosyltransferase [Streptomyces sp. NPDC055103]